MSHLKRKLVAFGLATLFAVIAASARAQTFSLEQVMSSPFPSELTVSKRGDKIAWAFDAEGKRNIWIAEAPAFNARQLTRSNIFAAEAYGMLPSWAAKRARCSRFVAP